MKVVKGTKEYTALRLETSDLIIITWLLFFGGLALWLVIVLYMAGVFQ